MHHLLTQPEIGLATGSVAMYLLSWQCYSQFIDQRPVVSRPTGLTFAFAYPPQVNIADGTIDNFSLYDLFVYMIGATLLCQLANHASHNASRAGSLHNNGPVTLHHLRAQLSHNGTLLC